MVIQGDLGIRDNAGKMECMCGMAEVALHPADDEGDLPQGCLDGTGIASMSDKAGGAAAGAFQLIVLDGSHDVIIKTL